jgi:hypothetical protein
VANDCEASEPDCVRQPDHVFPNTSGGLRRGVQATRPMCARRRAFREGESPVAIVLSGNPEALNKSTST